jgi:hypothetical protein
MKRGDESWQTKVTLPAGIEGTLEWQNQSHPLTGTTDLQLPVG